MNRIGVNARVLGKENKTGVGEYTLNLLSSLGKRSEDDNEYILFGVESVPEPLSSFNRISAAGEVPREHSGLEAHFWEQLQLPRRLPTYNLDVFHTPAGQPPITADVPLVTTIHDISPIVHPEWFSTKYALLYKFLTPLAIRASNEIITISKFAASELVERYTSAADKTTAIYNGVSVPPKSTDLVSSLNPDSFALFVGSINPRKNLSTLVNAYRRYRSQSADPLDLVLVGPNVDTFADVDLREINGVRRLGYVSDEQLGWLYRNARMLTFPTLYEGFGLPIVEAMSVGTPVITSNRGAMAEVADDAALLVDPLDEATLADAIDRLNREEELRDRLKQAGVRRAERFDWEYTARQTIEVYNRVAGQA